MPRPPTQDELEAMFAATDEARANERWAKAEGQDTKREEIRYIGPAVNPDESPAGISADDHPLEVLRQDELGELAGKERCYVRDRRGRTLGIEYAQLALKGGIAL